MPNSGLENNEKILKIISILAENPRSSIRKISASTGLKYMYIRRSISRLCDKKMISFSLMISSSVMGQHVAYIRGKGEDIDRFLEKLSNCNKILVVFRVNHSEFGLLVYGRNKEEIAEFIDMIRTGGRLFEISVEYGLLPSEAMIPIKNSNLKCKIPVDCEKCIFENLSLSEYGLE